MRCHVCNAEVGDNQRFCHECGESLVGVTDPTETLDVDALLVSEATSDCAAPGDESVDQVVDDRAADSDDDLADGPDRDLDDATVVAAAAGSVVGSVDGSATPPTQAVELGTDDGLPDPWAVPTGDRTVSMAATTNPESSLARADDATVTAESLAAPDPSVDATVTPGDFPADPVAGGEATTTLAAVGAAAAAADDRTVRAFTDQTALVTGEMPHVYDGVVDAGPYPPASEPARFRLTLVVGFLAVLTAVLASVADITDVRTDRVVPGIENRLRTLDDIGSNLVVAAFIGAGFILVGGVLHCFNQRWGAGLAGGAGLALGGWAAVTIGLAEVPIAVAERITRDPSTPGPFILTVTRDLGYWLIVAMGVLGGLAFLLSLVSAGSGGRRGLDPWTAAVGALGGVIAAAGPLVPVGNATFASNFGVNELPLAFFAGRLVQIGALGVGVMLGFLLVRRWGLGLAGGALAIPAFMWITTLLDIGDAPIGIGVGNLGTADITPHAVTTVGMSISLVMLFAAAMLALLQRDR